MTSSRDLLSSLDVSAARFVGDVREEILIAFLEELKERGLKKSDIARLLKVNRSAISRVLNGSAALELRTIGQLAWALGRDAQFKLAKKKARSSKSNGVAITNSANGFGPLFSATETP
jgi:transcriptional regulator with XRE-family HTH domain